MNLSAALQPHADVTWQGMLGSCQLNHLLNMAAARGSHCRLASLKHTQAFTRLSDHSRRHTASQYIDRQRLDVQGLASKNLQRYRSALAMA